MADCMSMLSHDNWMRVDPDHRQHRGNGPVILLDMTKEEVWAKWGPPTGIKRVKTGFIISSNDVERVSKRRRK